MTTPPHTHPPVAAAGRVLTLHHLAEWVLTQRPRLGSVRLVTVDGHSGAGKTSFATRLAWAMRHAPVVHMDHLYEGWDGLADVGPRLDAWVLAPLRSSLPGRHLVYDWHRGAYAEWREVPLTPAVVVEGVGSGQRLVDPWATLRIWVDCEPDERTRRSIEREGEASREKLARWAIAEQEHYGLQQTRDHADLLVNSSGAGTDRDTSVFDRHNGAVDRDTSVVVSEDRIGVLGQVDPEAVPRQP